MEVLRYLHAQGVIEEQITVMLFDAPCHRPREPTGYRMVLKDGGAIVSLVAPSDAFLVPTTMIVWMHPKRSSGDKKPRGDPEGLVVTARRIEDEV
ncbi:hypothetical protein [Rhodococcus qingshengii]|uniref:hypothetical protein n=1 Tax=Rhodococcus qingshengii TaxID=334542 RepID=UPI001E649E13|nr:hypothetical protein [Rhodococcus qingshengii]UDF21106.1 hypothetical protein LE551_28160 [Rhodococcus qingshengii]